MHLLIFDTFFRFINNYAIITKTDVQSSIASVQTSNGNNCAILTTYNQDLVHAVSTE